VQPVLAPFRLGPRRRSASSGRRPDGWSSRRHPWTLLPRLPTVSAGRPENHVPVGERPLASESAGDGSLGAMRLASLACEAERGALGVSTRPSPGTEASAVGGCGDPVRATVARTLRTATTACEIRDASRTGDCGWRRDALEAQVPEKPLCSGSGFNGCPASLVIASAPMAAAQKRPSRRGSRGRPNDVLESHPAQRADVGYRRKPGVQGQAYTRTALSRPIIVAIRSASAMLASPSSTHERSTLVIRVATNSCTEVVAAPRGAVRVGERTGPAERRQQPAPRR